LIHASVAPAEFGATLGYHSLFFRRYARLRDPSA